jgi:hypothetical protein
MLRVDMCGISLDAYRFGLASIWAYRSLVVFGVEDDQMTRNQPSNVYFCSLTVIRKQVTIDGRQAVKETLARTREENRRYPLEWRELTLRYRLEMVQWSLTPGNNTSW